MLRSVGHPGTFELVGLLLYLLVSDAGGPVQVGLAQIGIDQVCSAQVGPVYAKRCSYVQQVLHPLVYQARRIGPMLLRSREAGKPRSLRKSLPTRKMLRMNSAKDAQNSSTIHRRVLYLHLVLSSGAGESCFSSAQLQKGGRLG